MYICYILKAIFQSLLIISTAYTLRTKAFALRDIAPFDRNVVYARNVIRNGGSHDDFVDVIVEDNVDGDDGIDIKINPDNALSGIKKNKCGYLLNSANSRFVRRKRIND